MIPKLKARRLGWTRRASPDRSNRVFPSIRSVRVPSIWSTRAFFAEDDSWYWLCIVISKRINKSKPHYYHGLDVTNNGTSCIESPLLWTSRPKSQSPCCNRIKPTMNKWIRSSCPLIMLHTVFILQFYSTTGFCWKILRQFLFFCFPCCGRVDKNNKCSAVWRAFRTSWVMSRYT